MCFMMRMVPHLGVPLLGRKGQIYKSRKMMYVPLIWNMKNAFPNLFFFWSMTQLKLEKGGGGRNWDWSVPKLSSCAPFSRHFLKEQQQHHYLTTTGLVKMSVHLEMLSPGRHLTEPFASSTVLPKIPAPWPWQPPHPQPCSKRTGAAGELLTVPVRPH